MEAELFDWEEIEECDDLYIAFNGITLKQDLGEFKEGENFTKATINYENGVLTLYRVPDHKNGIKIILKLVEDF